jgi:hypothetical protein
MGENAFGNALFAPRGKVCIEASASRGQKTALPDVSVVATSPSRNLRSMTILVAQFRLLSTEQHVARRRTWFLCAEAGDERRARVCGVVLGLEAAKSCRFLLLLKK